MIAAPRSGQSLAANGREAIAAGVYGVPTFVVEGELFWGLDATDMLLDYLADRRCSTPEMRRIAALPVGAAGKET